VTCVSLAADTGSRGCHGDDGCDYDGDGDGGGGGDDIGDDVGSMLRIWTHSQRLRSLTTSTSVGLQTLRYDAEDDGITLTSFTAWHDVEHDVTALSPFMEQPTLRTQQSDNTLSSRRRLGKIILEEQFLGAYSNLRQTEVFRLGGISVTARICNVVSLQEGCTDEFCIAMHHVNRLQ